MAAKKTNAPSAHTTKEPARQKAVMQRSAPAECYFYLGDGRPIKNLLELADILDEMHDDLFFRHVGPGKDDFATWVRQVFGDEVLARRLEGSTSRLQHEIVILRHLLRREV